MVYFMYTCDFSVKKVWHFESFDNNIPRLSMKYCVLSFTPLVIISSSKCAILHWAWENSVIFTGKLPHRKLVSVGIYDSVTWEVRAIKRSANNSKLVHRLKSSIFTVNLLAREQCQEVFKLIEKSPLKHFVLLCCNLVRTRCSVVTGEKTQRQ